MNKPKKKYTKVGSIMNGQYGEFAVTGNTKASDPKWNYTVEIRITDGHGNKVQVKNPKLSIMDPRKRPGITEEQLGKIPENLVNELFLVQDAE